MPSGRGAGSARRVVVAKILLTVVIALIGSVLVYAGYKAGMNNVQVLGLIIVAISPILSYMLVLTVFRG
ncbi:MAG: hypothetical protein GSR86_04760 [Desulfurococcales archaeon]|nr:hypothetical protein [Desulfurococcales archaeon]